MVDSGRRPGRRGFMGLTGGALLLPSLARAQAIAPATEILPHERALYDAARKANESATWYVSHYTSETAEQIGRAFEATYPGIKANVVRTTAQVAFQRLSQDMRARVRNCDVFSSTDIGQYTMLKADGHLEKFHPENLRFLFESFQQSSDRDGFYWVTSAGTVLINFNTRHVQAADAPKKWTDLLDPRWRNRIAVGHPSFSGYVGNWVVAMRLLYGWDYFKTLERNKPQIGRSINDTVTMLNSGERWVGAGPGATTQNSASKGNPLAIVYPEDGTLLMIATTAIMKSTRNPNAARLFVEFLMGKRTNEIHAANFTDTTRPDVPPYPGAKDLGTVKLLRPTDAEIEKGIPEIRELWRDTFGV
jgi:iron(III) transport system substrate-binding protein